MEVNTQNSLQQKGFKIETGRWTDDEKKLFDEGFRIQDERATWKLNCFSFFSFSPLKWEKREELKLCEVCFVAAKVKCLFDQRL